jgi:predicted O-methyltransferase YrrM
MAGRDRYRKEWEQFAEMLCTGIRPTTFDAAWRQIPAHISGQYEDEARALWTILRKINPTSLVEVGRNLGGTLFLFACACPNLKEVLSIDLQWFDTTDDLWVEWFADHGIKAKILECDSTQFQPFGMYDFVFIDGGHTGEIAKKDIEIWRDHCHYIGFHDFADKGTNKHRRAYPEVVREIKAASLAYKWQQFGERGRSDIVYRTGL